MRDFIKFFNHGTYVDLSSFIYINPENDTNYQELLEYHPYYINREEIEIIESEGKKISNLIGGAKTVVELGPGYGDYIKKKTIGFLRSLRSFSKYTALDINEEFAKIASREILSHFPDKKSDYTVCNFLTSSGKELNQIVAPSCICLFGATICNLTDSDIKKLFDNFFKRVDFLVLGVDLNHDPVTLAGAYNNYWMKQLALNIMRYCKYTFDVDGFDPEKFDFIYKWNEVASRVEVYLSASISQSFFLGGEKIEIQQGDVFYLFSSRKYSEKSIVNMLKSNGFELMDSLKKDKKVAIIIAKNTKNLRAF